MPSSKSEFEEYIRQNYSSIAGAPLVIEDIVVYEDWVDLLLDSDSIVYVLRNEADARAYADRLLDDIIAYEGTEDCTATVSNAFYTAEIEDEYYDSDWYYIGSHSDRGWLIVWSVVKAYSFEGRARVIRVWSP